MSEFLYMGGYAPYVWSAYGITLAALVLNVWWIRRLHRRGLEQARNSVEQVDSARQATVRQV
ncbi:MAG TPA: heme exporter protein CcmD [Gammaproteobacteria bacterium]